MKAITIITMLLSLNVWAIDTDRLPHWAQEQNRTQGGSWIWFPGYATASTAEEADVLARGKAVDYLMQECRFPHKDARFVERLEMKEDDVYHVWTRVSVTHEQCNQTKQGGAVNNRLLEMYRFYRSHVAQLHVDPKICNDENLYCLEQAVREYDLRNNYVALEYARISCSKGIEGGCKVAKGIAEFLSRFP